MAYKSETKTKRIIWKPTVIPKGFVLIRDTREQKPLFANPPKGLTIVDKKLEVGDYSIQGFENFVCIERKMVSDLYAFIRDHDTHTVFKLCKMKAIRMFACLLIEASERKLSHQQPHTKLTPEHIRGFLKTVRAGYGIHVYTSGNRTNLERFVLDHLCYCFKVLSGLKRM